MPDVSDQELVALICDGDERAFEKLVTRYHAPVYAVVRGVLGDRDDVEDVIQLTYVKVFRGIRRFRGDARLSTWMCQIARNEAINATRRKVRHYQDIDEWDAPSPNASPEDVAIESDASRHLESALEEIEPQYREVLELRYMGDRSYEEIAQVTRLPLGTVKTYIYRGKTKLKAAYLKRVTGKDA